MENRIDNQESDTKKNKKPQSHSITQEEIYRTIREAYDVSDNKEDWKIYIYILEYIGIK